MTRKLKALGLAFFAVMAMGALSAATASADFHSEATHTNISGAQVGEDQLTVTAGVASCQEATYTGTQSGATSTTLTIKPKYTECKAFGFINTTIDVGTCEFELSGDNHFVNIVNCGSTPITVTAFNCWVTVGNQNGLYGFAYTNTGGGSGRSVDVGVNISGLTYTQHSKTFPGCEGGSMMDGTLTGGIVLTGRKSEGNLVGFWR